MFSQIRKQPYRLFHFSRQMADLHFEMHTKDAQNLEPVTERLAGKIDAVEALDRTHGDDVLVGALVAHDPDESEHRAAHGAPPPEVALVIGLIRLFDGNVPVCQINPQKFSRIS